MYYGDFELGDTVYAKFTTVDTGGVPFALASGAVSAYLDDNATELTAGITLTSPFDSRTGMHHLTVVASNGNGYAIGTDYILVITTGTVNSVSAVGYVVGSFSIENRGIARERRAARAIVTATIGAASTTTNIVTSAMDPSAAVADQFKGRILIFDAATTTANLRGQATDITASTSGGVLTVSALSTAPVSGDTATIT